MHPLQKEDLAWSSSLQRTEEAMKLCFHQGNARDRYEPRVLFFRTRFIVYFFNIAERDV